MDRQAEMLKHITKEKRGIEVGPWFSPLAPKRKGYNCLSLDIFDAEKLVEIAKRDPLVPDDEIPSIEPVDLIGPSTVIDKIVEQRGGLGTFDYVLSSHNFEHSPNPVKFLQGCGRVLRPDGFLSMAVPDKRACFDYFRPHTTFGQWIEAFFADRERPTFAQIFEQYSLHSRLQANGEARSGFALTDDPSNVCALPTLREAFGAWVRCEETKDTTYRDVHCWIFTPSSFRLLMDDSSFLGLSPFEVAEVNEGTGGEFYAHLRNVGHRNYTAEQTTRHYAKRQQLLHAVGNECSYNSVALYRTRKSVQELEDLIAQLRANIADVQTSIDDRQAQIDDLHLSTSWKITAPLRWLKKGTGSW